MSRGQRTTQATGLANHSLLLEALLSMLTMIPGFFLTLVLFLNPSFHTQHLTHGRGFSTRNDPSGVQSPGLLCPLLFIHRSGEDGDVLCRDTSLLPNLLFNSAALHESCL